MAEVLGTGADHGRQPAGKEVWKTRALKVVAVGLFSVAAWQGYETYQAFDHALHVNEQGDEHDMAGDYYSRLADQGAGGTTSAPNEAPPGDYDIMAALEYDQAKVAYNQSADAAFGAILNASVAVMATWAASEAVSSVKHRQYLQGLEQDGQVVVITPVVDNNLPILNPNTQQLELPPNYDPRGPS